MNKLLTEFIGTFFLVLGIALMAPSGSALTPLIIGLGLMVMVYMGGPISGAHYNPAVTLAVFLRGKIKAADAVPYVMVQIAGALAAAAIGMVITGDCVRIAPGTGVSLTTALLAEVIFTFALALVVLNVATVKQTAGNSYYGLAIGMTVAVGAACVGRVSGGAFNPAVGLGLAVIAAVRDHTYSFLHVWLYLVGPAVGAVLAAMAFRAQHGTSAD